jgi:DSF synthase
MPSIAFSQTSALSMGAKWMNVLPAPVLPAVPLLDARKNEDARRLFELEQLEVTWEDQIGALWTFMRPRGRPAYNLDLLDDIYALQRSIVAEFADRPGDLRYLVAGSRTPGVFSLGGDLELFATAIRNRNRAALLDYGKSCVRVLHRFLTALGLPIITIGLAQGDALGGGLESLLSFDVIIAERTAKFGFPEIMFGMFPGMGACSLVTRRTSASFAQEMMLTGRTYSADEMKEAGLVHLVVEPEQGIAAARDYMQRNKRRHVGARSIYRAGFEVNPITLAELSRVVSIWADTCLELSERDLKIMQRLVAAQDKLQYTPQAAE